MLVPPPPRPHQVEVLVDQRKAGKQLALITNSDWVYTSTLMQAHGAPACPNPPPQPSTLTLHPNPSHYPSL